MMGRRCKVRGCKRSMEGRYIKAEYCLWHSSALAIRRYQKKNPKPKTKFVDGIWNAIRADRVVSRVNT
jgi:hypothetical protein